MKIRYIGWLNGRPRPEETPIPGPLPPKRALKSSWEDVLARFRKDPNKPPQDDPNEGQDKSPKSKAS